MKHKLYLLVLALQTVWLLEIVVQQERGLHAAHTVLLETMPVDPRDPLRGDYVRFNYAISDVPVERFLDRAAVVTNLPTSRTVYVALAAGTNGFWTVSRAGTGRFATTSNEVLMCGRTAWSGRNGRGSIHLEYGLEEYYVAEGTGNPHGKVTVQAALTDAGKAIIKEVFVDGKPYQEVMKGRN